MPELELTTQTHSLAKAPALAQAQTFAQRLLDESRPAPQQMLRLWHTGQEPQTISYTSWLAEAARYASLYTECGAQPGDKIVIIQRHGFDLYASIVAAWLGGFIPSVWAFPSPKVRADDYATQLSALLELVEPRVIVTYAELRSDLRQRSLAARTTIVTDQDLSESPQDPDQFRNAASRIQPDDIALLQFSSGTTGLKKGVALSHAAVLWQVDQYAGSIKLCERDRIVSWLPLYHDMGLIACLIMPLMQRTAISVICPFEWSANPNLWLQAITQDQATLSWLPNFAYNFMANRSTPDALPDCDLSSLRAVVNCSEPVQESSHTALLQRLTPHGLNPAALATTYALAENTFAATVGGFDAGLAVDCVDGIALARDRVATPMLANSPRARTLVSSGRPLPETKVTIVDEAGVPLPDRHVGEIVLQSPCLLSEYYRNPEATQQALRHGSLYTGDLGYLANDELYVVGRQKEMLIIRGQNVFPQDVEAIVNSIEGVIPGRVAAVGVPSESAGTDELVILAETQLMGSDRDQLDQNIRRNIVRRLDLTPAEVFLTEHMWLRKSTAGKISRNINRDRYLMERQRRKNQRIIATQNPPTAASDAHLIAARQCVQAALVGTTVNTTDIQLDQPLINSGLIDSLALAGLLTALEQQTGNKIEADQLRDLTPFDTITSLADWIRDHTTGQPTIPPNLQTIPTSTCEHPGEQPRPIESIPLEALSPIRTRPTVGWWTRYYRWAFWRHGIKCGPGLRVYGRLLLRLDGDARNIRIGRNVTLLPGVELKVRENGRIILHDGVALDTNVRLVAAREGYIKIGAGAAIGMGTVINAGAPVVIGRGSSIGGYSLINASEPIYQTRKPILEQPYEHAPITIDEDVYGGFYAFIKRGSQIGRGAVLGVRSSISGSVPPYAVMLGDPARIVRWRGEAEK
jgi:fatty-acyl-CoA synthase